MYMFSSGTGPAPNPGRAIALHLLRNCVSHMSGRMPAAFCAYPTVHIKSERKCICLYIQNVLRAAVIKNVYTLPYAFIYQKSVYITIHTKPLCTAHFPAAGSNVHTHAYAFYFKKVYTLPYIPICRQQSGKEDKTQFCGQVNDCNQIAQCKGAAPALLLLFHCPRCAYNLPAIHPAAAPRSRLPATLSRCRAHKNKKKT